MSKKLISSYEVFNKEVKWSGGTFIAHKIKKDGKVFDLRITKALTEKLGECELLSQVGKFVVSCDNDDIWLVKQDKDGSELKYPFYRIKGIESFEKVIKE